MQIKQQLNQEDFWKQVNKTDTCWLWIGYKTFKGYGELYYNGKKYQAHRLSFELLKGPIIPGLELDHICLNEACVNPAHLEPVTKLENISRKFTPEAIEKRRQEMLTPEWRARHMESVRKTKEKRLRIIDNIYKYHENMGGFNPDKRLPTEIKFWDAIDTIWNSDYHKVCNCFD